MSKDLVVIALKYKTKLYIFKRGSRESLSYHFRHLKFPATSKAGLPFRCPFVEYIDTIARCWPISSKHVVNRKKQLDRKIANCNNNGALACANISAIRRQRENWALKSVGGRRRHPLPLSPLSLAISLALFWKACHACMCVWVGAPYACVCWCGGVTVTVAVAFTVAKERRSGECAA